MRKGRKGLYGCLVVLCCSVVLASGCAKKELVKTEEPVTPPAPAATTPTTPPAKQEPIAAQPVKEAPVATAEETAQAPKAVAPEQTLEMIHFDFDSYALSQAARDVLSKNAELLLKNQAKVQIAGNCDERGSDEYNLALGEKRANAAKNYLVTLGVADGRISTISYGKEKPLDPGHNEEAWAKNRRDEFIIVQ